MTIPEDRAAAGRPPGKEEPATRWPRGALSAGAGGTVSGADGGKRPGGPVLPCPRSLLPNRGTANFPNLVLNGVSASTRGLW